MSLRFSCSTICFRTSPIETALAEIKQIGFRALDLAVIPGFCPHFDASTQTAEERKRFVDLIGSSGFKVPTVTAVPGHFNEPDADFRQIVAAGIANVNLAAEIGADRLNVNCGKPIDDRSKYEEQALLQARGLKRIAQAAAERSVAIVVEAPHRNGLARTLDEAEFLVDAIAEDNIEFLVDTTHIQAGGARPEEAIRRFAGRIGCVHIRDGKGEDIFYVPGEGDIEFRPFFKELKRVGYDGYCAFELEGVAETIEERRDALRRSIEFIRTQTEDAVSLPKLS